MSKPIGPYSSFTRAGDLVFLAGQVGKADGVVCDGVTEQTRQALRNVEDVLRAIGATLDDVVNVTVYLADMGDFDTMNAAYADVFGSHRPARTTVAVSGLPGGDGVALEVAAVAHVPVGVGR